MIVREIPASFAFRLHCAKLQDAAERKERAEPKECSTRVQFPFFMQDTRKEMVLRGA